MPGPCHSLFVCTVGFAIAIIVDTIITDFSGTAVTARGVVPAIAVLAVDPAVTIVVDAVIADLRGTATAIADRVAVTVLSVRTIHLLVTVIVDTVVADFGFAACLSNRGIYALVVIAVHISIAVIVCRVVTDFRGAGVDSGVLSSQSVAAPPLQLASPGLPKPSPSWSMQLDPGQKYAGSCPERCKRLAFGGECASATRVDMAQAAVIVRVTGAVDAVGIGIFRYRVDRQQGARQ